MAYKIECGPKYKGPTMRADSEYLPFVKVPTESLPSGVNLASFHPLRDKVGGRVRYALGVRVHAKADEIVLEEDQSNVTPPPSMRLFHDQLRNLDKGGLQVSVYDPVEQTEEICIIKPVVFRK